MANTYYDSDLTGEQIEQALEAIDGVIVPANNGKVLAIENGKIKARSVQWDADLGPKSITENGTYNPASDNLDGYSQVTVNVSGGGGTTDANHVTYNSSETYDSGTVGAALNEQRNTLNHKADVIYDTASGDIASFPDGADGLPVKDLTVGIEPVQDLHGWDYPFPPGASPNIIYDGTDTSNGYAAKKYLKADGSTGNADNNNISEYFPVTASTVYTISQWTANMNAASVGFYDSSKAFISGEAFSQRSSFQITSPANAAFCRITLSNVDHVQMELGSTPSDYMPYSNVCPIHGFDHCGISVFNENAVCGIPTNATINVALGTDDIIISPDSKRIAYLSNTGRPVFIKVDKKPFYVTINSGYQFLVFGFDESYAMKSSSAWITASQVISNTANSTYVIFVVSKSDKTQNISPSEDTGIGAYLRNDAPQETADIGMAYTVEFSPSAGTVYGGTLDVISGVLTVTMASIAMDSISWSTQTIGSLSAFLGDFGTSNIRGDNATDDSYLCTCYKYICDSRAVLENNNCAFTPQNQTTSYKLALRDDRFSTVEALTTALAGEMLVYELKTPVIIQLDPVTVTTLLGQNNIWSDCGPSIVEYPCDTKLYIERLTAPEEDDMIANQNIASGVYFMVGNNLYLSTTAILAGDPIKPGTNCTATNLAAALNALNS